MAAPAPANPAEAGLRVYRPRHPERTAFYQLFEKHFDRYLFAYDERFEPRFGPLRSVVGPTVNAFLECGRLLGGFARLRCPSCRGEHLLAFSCQTRNFSVLDPWAATCATVLTEIPVERRRGSERDIEEHVVQAGLDVANRGGLLRLVSLFVLRHAPPRAFLDEIAGEGGEETSPFSVGGTIRAASRRRRSYHFAAIAQKRGLERRG